MLKYRIEKKVYIFMHILLYIYSFDAFNSMIKFVKARFVGVARNSYFRKFIRRLHIRWKLLGQGKFSPFDKFTFSILLFLDNEYKSILYYSGTSLKLGVPSSLVLLSREFIFAPFLLSLSFYLARCLLLRLPRWCPRCEVITLRTGSHREYVR